MASMCSADIYESVKGVIDVHCHCDPDSLPRPINALDLARLAKSRGMRGLVLKNHYESTASMAYMVRKHAAAAREDDRCVHDGLRRRRNRVWTCNSFSRPGVAT